MEIYFIIHNIEDILGATEASAPLAGHIIYFSRFFTLYFSKRSFYDILDRITALAQSITTTSNLIVLKQVNLHDHKFALTFLIAALTTVGEHCTKPIILNLIGIFIYGSKFNPEMPFKSSFPYDVENSPAYEVSYAIFCYACFISVISTLS